MLVGASHLTEAAAWGDGMSAVAGEKIKVLPCSGCSRSWRSSTASSSSPHPRRPHSRPARGRVGGRRPRLTPEQAALAQQLYDARDKTVAQIAALFGVPRSTICGHLTIGSGSTSTKAAGAAPASGTAQPPARQNSRATSAADAALKPTAPKPSSSRPSKPAKVLRQNNLGVFGLTALPSCYGGERAGC